jgi:hypothetical protein
MNRIFYILVLILSGCASTATDIGGFSSWDSSPTASTLASAEQKRQVFLEVTKGVLGKVQKGTLSDEERKAAKDVVGKFRDLVAVTEMGVSYMEYPKYVRDVKIATSRFANDYPKQELGVAFNLVLEPYLSAMESFQDYIKYRDGTHGRGEARFYLHDNWKTGSQAVTLLNEKMLNL